MVGKGEKREREEPAEEPDQPAEEPQTEEKSTGDQVDEPDKKAGDGDNGPLESGRLYFFYRPRVALETVNKLDDIQRFHMVFEPVEPKGAKCRLVVVPKKRLPDPARHERFFGFVGAVGSSVKELTEGLEGEEHETKTRGTRKTEPARAAGEAAYVLSQGAKGHKGTRLAYKLEIPEQPGEAQKTLKIHNEGSFTISLKNPDNKSSDPRIPQMNPEFSEPQRKRFKGYAWLDVEDRSMLDVKGAMLLLVGARDDPKVDVPEEALNSMEEVFVDDEQDIEAKAGKDQDKTEAAAEKLKNAVEPGKDEPLPVEPAITGKLM